MYVSQILIPRNNNFDLFRLIAALMVIYGHAYAFVPDAVNTDIVARLLNFDYSGSLAVKFFFMLSGMLVTASLLAKPQVVEFIIKRVARIIPGLFVCLCVSTFIVGPFFSTLGIGEYFSQQGTWNYLIHNTFLYQQEWFLPGVFSDSKHGVNGSLWTLPLEFVCYLFLAAFYGLGVWRIQWLSNLVLLGVIFLSFVMPQLLPPLFGNNKEAHLLPGCFALGALFATNQNNIVVNAQGVFVLGLLTTLLWTSGMKLPLFYLFFFYVCLYVGSINLVVEKLRIPADPSYGVYIYGFLIQQSLAHLFPEKGVVFNQFLSAIIAIIVGALSWFFIEKPGIRFTKKILAQEDLLIALRNFNMVQFNKALDLMTARNVLIFIGLLSVAWLMHFIVLYFIFPGHYNPLAFHHSDFYIPAAFAYASGDGYSFANLLNWPRPLFMYSYKLSGYLGHPGSVAWVVTIVFLNCALLALLVKRVLNLKIDAYFCLFYALYCYLLFSQPYFYTFYSQDIGSQLSFLLLLLGSLGFVGLVEKNNILASVVLFLCATCAFLVKETYILSMGFITFCWFVYYVKQDRLKSIAPGIAVLFSVMIAALVNFKTKSVFVNLEAEQGSDYHINLSPLSILQELARYSNEAIAPALVVVFGLLLFQLYKSYKNRMLVIAVFACAIFALLSWLPNALLPFHHYQGYSFNGLYVFFAIIFFAAKMLQDQRYSKKTLWILTVLAILSPLSSLHNYGDSRNTWVIAQEKIQINMLAGFTKATAQLLPMEKNITVLITGITAPFHPFAFPESIRSFKGGSKANYYFVVPKEFPVNLGKTVDLVSFIAESDKAAVTYDQEWQFDEQGNLLAIHMKK
jgi:peptidoglycan/LPS O-acetylase OafA/YrhL